MGNYIFPRDPFSHFLDTTEMTQGPCQAQIDSCKGGAGEKARIYPPRQIDQGDPLLLC
jgi:hypothetical protein